MSPLLSPDESLHSPSLAFLPFDVVEDVLCRLPVKSLLRFRCVCKPWNSLISDPKFSKKHLSVSTTHRFFFLRYSILKRKFLLTSYPLDSLFTTTTSKVTQLEYPPYDFDGKYPPCHLRNFVGSCNGILCLADIYENFVLLWNPSIRKFKELPPLEMPKVVILKSYGFGYDPFTDKYKVVAVSYYPTRDSNGSKFSKLEVKVHTLGTNFWRRIQGFPAVPIDSSGKSVSGTVNWLASTNGLILERPHIIVSLDLQKESYQEVLQPDYGGVVDAHRNVKLSVLMDCLCILSGHDVWVMKEYGNKESWAKLFTVPNMQGPGKSYFFTEAVYIFDDDRVLLESRVYRKQKLIVYDYLNDYFKFTKFENTPEFCVESLISPSM